MKKIILIFFIYCIVNSCNKQEDFIQDVYVSEFVDLSLPQYSEINITGNAFFIEGGVEGIIIFKDVGDNFKIYDRNCSYEPSSMCAKIDSISSGIAFCGCCSSAFLISSSGEAINAPAILPLKKYSWSLSNNILHIYN